MLERAGHRVISYDARGHGESSPAGPPEAYTYDALVADAVAVLDALGVERAIVAGQSMGSATAVGLALRHPERVGALAVVTPAHRGAPSPNLDHWDGLAAGLERGGPEGFLEALGPFSMAERYRDAVRTVIHQRLGRHKHPDAVAQALRGIPRSAEFDGLEALAAALTTQDTYARERISRERAPPRQASGDSPASSVTRRAPGMRRAYSSATSSG